MFYVAAGILAAGSLLVGLMLRPHAGQTVARSEDEEREGERPGEPAFAH